MDKKIIVGIVVVIVIIAAAAVVLAKGNGGGNDDKEEYTDASQIAASFSKDYSGVFGKDFYLDDSASKSEAKVYYPNGSTSGYGSTDNFLKFYVYSDAAKAKESFDTNKADYEGQIGKSVMGATVQGTTEKASLDDAIGYFNNLNMGSKFCYIYYTGYSANFFFEGYIYLPDASLTASSAKELAEAISKALENPVSTDQAKKYVAPDVPVEYKGAALICNNLVDFAKKYGSNATDYAVTSDSTAMSAKLATSDGKYYIEVQISSDAKSLYDAAAADISAAIGTTAMSAEKMAINENTGLDGGIGWYYNASSVKMTDYAGYSGNYYFHLHLRSATDITDASAAEMVKEIAPFLKA